MNQRQILRAQMLHRGPRGEPRGIVGGQRGARPFQRPSRGVAKQFQRHIAQRALVVISRQSQRVQLPQAFHTFIRLGAIPDYIAQTPDAIVRRRGAQRRFERAQIGVNIREQ